MSDTVKFKTSDEVEQGFRASCKANSQCRNTYNELNASTKVYTVVDLALYDNHCQQQECGPPLFSYAGTNSDNPPPLGLRQVAGGKVTGGVAAIDSREIAGNYETVANMIWHELTHSLGRDRGKIYRHGHPAFCGVTSYGGTTKPCP